MLMKLECVVNDKKATIYCYRPQQWVGRRGGGSWRKGDMCGKGGGGAVRLAFMARETATAADGTHPTGMHYCYEWHFEWHCCILLFLLLKCPGWSEEVMVHSHWMRPTQRPIPIPWNSIISASRQCDHCYTVSYKPFTSHFSVLVSELVSLSVDTPYNLVGPLLMSIEWTSLNHCLTPNFIFIFYLLCFGPEFLTESIKIQSIDNKYVTQNI